MRAVLAELNSERDAPLAYTTVLSRLAERGVVRRQRTGRGYAYCAEYGSVAEMAVRQLLDDYGDAALASFVEQVGNQDRGDLRK